ncbi:MAG: hypothetical protein GY757_53000 [bacterium]|nr:hypothetical protein [bacterium]
MKLDLYINKTSNIVAENRLMKFVVLVLATSTILCLYYTNEAVRHQRTVIIPVFNDKKLVVTDNKVNDDYIKTYARMIVNLLLSYNPRNCEDQFGDLLYLASPDFYPELLLELNDIKDTVMRIQLTSGFYPYKYEVLKDKKEIHVFGTRRKHTGSVLVNEGAEIYSIKYSIVDGRFFIDNLMEIEK